MDVQRLDRFVSSQMGEISRSAARDLIKKGGVEVNGAVERRPERRISPESDEISVSGAKIEYKKHLYIMLNKPAGVVCATRDGLSQSVIELLPKNLIRAGLFPAGRLDKDSVGFVLITDDGALAHRILSPKSHVKKKYFVRLKNPLSGDEEAAFAGGMVIDGDEKCLPAELRRLSEKECEVILCEGKYHQVKRMFSALGNEVVYLKRTEIAGIELDPALEEGRARELSLEEAAKLTL